MKILHTVPVSSEHYEIAEHNGTMAVVFVTIRWYNGKENKSRTVVYLGKDFDEAVKKLGEHQKLQEEIPF